MTKNTNQIKDKIKLTSQKIKEYHKLQKLIFGNNESIRKSIYQEFKLLWKEYFDNSKVAFEVTTGYPTITSDWVPYVLLYESNVDTVKLKKFCAEFRKTTSIHILVSKDLTL